jgi:uncharacterized protein
MNLNELETALIAAMKAHEQLKVDTLRGLKTRITNEQIAKGGELAEADILTLVQSEVKRRKEAAIAFRGGDRGEAAAKEEAEAAILAEFLPPQMSEEEIATKVDAKMAEHSWTAKDFGSAMGALKAELGQTADGAVIAKILKEKLK